VSVIGEAFVGEGSEAAHINVVLGHSTGPVGTAWATALATPREGHAPFMVCLQPNLPVKPATLFVNKATLAHDQHAALHWGAAQSGVASGVLRAVAEGLISKEKVDEQVLLVAVWVAPEAQDADLVYEFNREATYLALRNAVRGLPVVDDVLAQRNKPVNGYYLPKEFR